MQQRALRCFSLLLYACVIVGAVWLTVRFFLPWAAPFLVAFTLAAVMEPAVRYLHRHGWRRGMAAALLTLTLLGLLLWGLWTLAAKGLAAVTDFARGAPELVAAIMGQLEALENRALAAVESAPEGISSFLEMALASVNATLNALPARLSQWVLDAVGRVAQAGPDALLFIATAGIGTYFVSASFPSVIAFLAAQLPEKWRRRLEGLGQDLKASFGGFLRTQLILMAMTFFELLLAFLLLRVPSAAGLAAVTALIDALPVFGTGTVLAPWALYCLLVADYGRCVALLGCWAVVNLVRNCAQAKLLGDQIGLNPLVSLIAVYVGWQVWGVWGMLLFPLLFVTVRQLNDKGIIKLWKTP